MLLQNQIKKFYNQRSGGGNREGKKEHLRLNLFCKDRQKQPKFAIVRQKSICLYHYCQPDYNLNETLQKLTRELNCP